MMRACKRNCILNLRMACRRLAMCPPNPRKSPILDSAEEQIGMAHMANNVRHLLDALHLLPALAPFSSSVCALLISQNTSLRSQSCNKALGGAKPGYCYLCTAAWLCLFKQQECCSFICKWVVLPVSTARLPFALPKLHICTTLSQTALQAQVAFILHARPFFTSVLACLQEKQLMELMARLSHDGNGSSLQSNKTPSVYSFGQNGSSDSGALSHATMSGIQVQSTAVHVWA